MRKYMSSIEMRFEMKIEVYDTNKKSSGCGCSCSCNSSSQYTREYLIKDLSNKLSDIEIKTVIVEDVKTNSLIDNLNELFRLNGERLTVNENTLYFTLSKILPLIVVDEKIKCINSIPTTDELIDAIEKNTRVKMKASCC